MFAHFLDMVGRNFPTHTPILLIPFLSLFPHYAFDEVSDRQFHRDIVHRPQEFQFIDKDAFMTSLRAVLGAKRKALVWCKSFCSFFDHPILDRSVFLIFFRRPIGMRFHSYKSHPLLFPRFSSHLGRR
jgi:hypothetical protein